MDRAYYVAIRPDGGYTRDIVGPFETAKAAWPFVGPVYRAGLVDEGEDCTVLPTDVPVGCGHRPAPYNDRFGWMPYLAGKVRLAADEGA
jgi:hypothetical protein